MTARETQDPAWRQTERDVVDSDLESSYEDRQNDGLEVDQDIDDEPPEDDEFCIDCGDVLDDAGDGYAGRCGNCADVHERGVAEIRSGAMGLEPSF